MQETREALLGCQHGVTFSWVLRGVQVAKVGEVFLDRTEDGTWTVWRAGRVCC